MEKIIQKSARVVSKEIVPEQHILDPSPPLLDYNINPLTTAVTLRSYQVNLEVDDGNSLPFVGPFKPHQNAYKHLRNGDEVNVCISSPRGLLRRIFLGEKVVAVEGFCELVEYGSSCASCHRGGKVLNGRKAFQSHTQYA